MNIMEQLKAAGIEVKKAETVYQGCSKFLSWRGVMACQSIRVTEVFTKDFLEQFSRIIELGTHRGGFSLFLADHFSGNVYSFDLKRPDHYMKGVGRNLMGEVPENLKLSILDILSSEGQKQISDLIKEEGRSLVLCDGGNKMKELDLFSPHLKDQDVIMLHDYEHSKESLSEIRQRSEWFFDSESYRVKADPILQREGLEEHEKYADFCEAIWGSFIKKPNA